MRRCVSFLVFASILYLAVPYTSPQGLQQSPAPAVPAAPGFAPQLPAPVNSEQTPTAGPQKAPAVNSDVASPPPSPAAADSPVPTSPEVLPKNAPVANSQQAPTANRPQTPSIDDDITPDQTAQYKVKKSDKADKKKPIAPPESANVVIWTDPGNISERNLLEGQGGAAHHPKPPFTFVEEDKSGTNPKFDVTDVAGDKWRVKVGSEAKPEVVASRLFWATGYFANDDYFVSDSTVPGIHMERKSASIHGDGRVTDARFSRRPSKEKKIGIWQWKNNPFIGTREFNGLRVMMALINGWDLKDDNNAVYQDEKTGRQIYLASDIGATFGTNGRALTRTRGKGNVDRYKDSKFITHVSAETVDFATPAKPTATLLTSMGFDIADFADRSGMQWIGRGIPRADVRWIASLLSQLSHQQIEDAFHAGGFNQKDCDEYVAIIESRIGELKGL